MLETTMINECRERNEYCRMELLMNLISNQMKTTYMKIYNNNIAIFPFIRIYFMAQWKMMCNVDCSVFTVQHRAHYFYKFIFGLYQMENYIEYNEKWKVLLYVCYSILAYMYHIQFTNCHLLFIIQPISSRFWYTHLH